MPVEEANHTSVLVLFVSFMCTVFLVNLLLVEKRLDELSLQLSSLIAIIALAPGILAVEAIFDIDDSPIWALLGAVAGYLFGHKPNSEAKTS
ncbi:MAG: hypothetical protein ACIAS6_15460 [Phycisphaerales bacterium JB060]